jgi:hypothetical protein
VGVPARRRGCPSRRGHAAVSTYDDCSLARWPHIRVAARDFDEQGEVVTAVRIEGIVIREG